MKIKHLLLFAALIGFALATGTTQYDNGSINNNAQDWIFVLGQVSRPSMRISCPNSGVRCERTISGSIRVPDNYRPAGERVETVYDRQFSANTNVTSYGLDMGNLGYIFVHYLSTGRHNYAETAQDIYQITATQLDYDDSKSLVTYIIKIRWSNNIFLSTVHYGFVFRMAHIAPPVCNLTCQQKVDPQTGNEMCECCGPVCQIFCENGNVLDEYGCPTCRCKPAPANQALVIYDEGLRLGPNNYLFTGNGPNTAANIDLLSADSPHSGARAVKMHLDSYSGPGDQFTIYFFANGNASGFNGISLANYNTLQFWAKTNRPLSVSANFGGGATDTGFKNLGDLHLTSQWTFFEFDIVRPNKELINTILWVVLGEQQNPNELRDGWEDVTLWLDDIVLTGRFTTGVSTCDYSSAWYNLRDPAKCAAVLFLCADYLEPFNNECGCGCKPIGLDVAGQSHA